MFLKPSLGLMGAVVALGLSACASTTPEIERAQATADKALATANQAMHQANNAGAVASQALQQSNQNTAVLERMMQKGVSK